MRQRALPQLTRLTDEARKCNCIATLPDIAFAKVVARSRSAVSRAQIIGFF
ncbi:hypothetical protein [Anaplasma phagocytophilum]|nr:hypothetical protein [Anaplasma phagocytophilum]KJV59520.1 hypothetical protein APHWEB_1514 [Anaplasma phagocytophilum str. Webster]KJV87654.1 hypothetical protein APHNYW_0526 [Anaplasma phagocytophilum str. ApNYW]